METVNFSVGENNRGNLSDRVDEMEAAIRKTSFRKGTGRANEVNYWVFDYPPEKELEVRARIEYMKGKNAIHIARTYLGHRKNYGVMSFRARGYFVSTVGADETVVRAYIRDQEKEDQRLEQFHLFK